MVFIFNMYERHAMKKILLATTIIVAGFALSTAAMAQATSPNTGTSGGTGASVPPNAGAPGGGGETNVGGTEPTNIPGHGRVNEVDQRDNNQQNRIDKGEADGQLSKGQAARDQSRLDHQEAQQKNQEAHNGGHLTKGEQRHDNRSLNHSSRNIHRQRHGGGGHHGGGHHGGGRHHR